MSKLQLILLGHFDCLLASGTRIALSMRKAEALLAFLALAPGLRHPRERLINLLWSDRGEEQARNSLRQALSSIKKSLGDVADLVLQIDRKTVSLNAALVEVDALEFERLALEGDYESLASAADLYQGEFLEGIAIRDAACQEWLDGERERFKRQYIEILFNLAETQLLSHDYNHAIRSAERLVEQDPLVESGWRLLMRSYFENGDRNHALQAFKRCQQILRAELEVGPEPATIELRERIAGGAIEPRSAPATAKIASPAPTTDSDHSIAVLPFDNLSGDPEQEYFSDGITDSIILNLSLFPGLRVKSRNSSFAFKQQLKSLGEISRELGVDYIVEGSVRKTETRIRVTTQLVEAASGNQLWGKRYDAEIEDLFDLEEELSRSIAATVTGKIESELQRIAIARGASDPRAYDLLLSGGYHLAQGDRNSVLVAIEEFHQCLSEDPVNARAHADLFYCHDLSVMDHWAEDVDRARELATEHILQAVALDPDSAYIQVAYANHLAFTHQFDEAERQLNRALEINPNDTEAIAMRAVCLSIRGESADALEQAKLALKLDPYHAWARWIRSECLYFCDRFEDCLASIAEIANPPGFIRIYQIAANIRLGRLENARRSLDEFLRFCEENMPSMPDSIEAWRAYYRHNAPFADPAKNDHIIDCLIEAGLEDKLLSESSNDEEPDQPSIAVLPFDNLSDDSKQAYFSDGITADIIDTLSKFKHLRTVSRHSTLPYKADKPSIRDIAEQQGVRYILEGSLRKSGDRIRVNAELIDSRDEAIVWSERYDRDLDDLFAVQDDITREIAMAMKVQLDDGDMARVRSRGATDIRAWELTMAAVDLQDTYVWQNILNARALATEATELDPGYAYAWISLGWTYWQEYYAGFSDSLELSIAEAEKAVRRARAIDPEYSEAYSLAGMIHLRKHEPEAAIENCLKAVELEPGNAEMQALTAFAYVFAGDYETARHYDQSVRKLCPLRANWYYLVEGQIEVAGGRLERAAEIFRQGLAVEPDSPLCRYFLVDLMLQMGDEAAARRYADEIRGLEKNASARGIAHSYSSDPALRAAFAQRLQKFDLI